MVFVVSAEEFTPGTGTNGAALTSGGFATIFKGITLSTSISSNRFKGIASEAAALNDSGVTLSASSLLRSDIGYEFEGGDLGSIRGKTVTYGVENFGEILQNLIPGIALAFAPIELDKLLDGAFLSEGVSGENGTGIGLSQVQMMLVVKKLGKFI